MQFTLFALLIALLLPAMTDASARPTTAASKSSSFKAGFSSQRAASTSTSGRAATSSPSFGGFGSAGPGRAQQSDSVLSQRLTKSAAEANALRTLDARRAADKYVLPTRHAPPIRHAPPPRERRERRQRQLMTLRGRVGKQSSCRRPSWCIRHRTAWATSSPDFCLGAPCRADMHMAAPAALATAPPRPCTTVPSSQRC